MSHHRPLALFTTFTYLTFTLVPPDVLAHLPSSTSVGGFDATTQSLTTATQVEPGKAYYVQLSSAKTWAPPLPKDPSSRYVYDGDGGKVKQTTATGTTTYLGEVYEKSSDGKIIKSVYAGSLRIATKHTTDGLRFIHGDHLGSSNVLTNASGQLVELTEHQPYGAISRADLASGQTGQKAAPAIGFTGQRQDTATTGLILFPARAYDPGLGRFTQPDTIVQDAADPQTLNRYSYVRNNPIKLVDPSGNLAFLAVIGAVLVKAAIGAAIGAVTSVAIGALTGQIHGWNDVGRLALSGAVSGAVMAVGGYALGAATKAFQLGQTAQTLTKVGIAATSGALGGGVDSSLQGGSFGTGAAIGAAGGILGYGADRALAGIGRRTVEGLGHLWERYGNQIALSQQFRQLLQGAGAGLVGSGDDVFDDIMRQVELADVRTPPNGAVVWNGYAQGNQARAMRWARQTGRSTIEMTPGGQWLDSLDLFGPNSPLTVEQRHTAWRRLSQRFTAEAEGEVTAFIEGTTFNPNSIFYGTEWPTLYGNAKVTRIRRGR